MDELKKIWQQKNGSEKHFTAEQLDNMIAQKSQSLLDKIKQTMKTDAIIMLVLGVAFIGSSYFAGLTNWYFIAIGLVLLIAILSVHYYLKLRLVNYKIDNADNLLTSLKATATQLGKYRKAYLAGIPIGTTLLFVGMQVFLSTLPPTPLSINNLWITILVSLLILAVSYGMGRWLLDKMYGTQLKELNDLITELTDQANA